jgi:predicted MFS family arabinose efflux permease
MRRSDSEYRSFALEGLNAFAMAFYLNYLFFFMAERFGFTNFNNLLLSALNGLVYANFAWLAGRFAQRFGYFRALNVGFAGMTIALVFGWRVGTAAGHVVALAGYSTALCFTWPTFEALVSERQPPHRLPRMVGIYNMVWATGSAAAYFTGGALLQLLGDGSLFAIPAALHLAQLGLVWRWHRPHGSPGGGLPAVRRPLSARLELNPRPIARARTFLRMAWVANPFAYVAISTVVAVIPGLAKRLDLSPMLAGFFCSIWFFARLAAFVVLWRWAGWHYRPRWFFGAYAGLVLGFGTILLATQVWVILVGQVVFGAAVGLIYYSSLYYSMDVGETKGVHGGIHEAVIGAGVCAGPAIGAASIYLFPDVAHSVTWAVTGLLLAGAVMLLWVQRRARI